MLGRGEGRGVGGVGGGNKEVRDRIQQKRKQNKKIIEDLSQAEAGLLRHSMLIEE